VRERNLAPASQSYLYYYLLKSSQPSRIFGPQPRREPRRGHSRQLPAISRVDCTACARLKFLDHRPSYPYGRPAALSRRQRSRVPCRAAGRRAKHQPPVDTMPASGGIFHGEALLRPGAQSSPECHCLQDRRKFSKTWHCEKNCLFAFPNEPISMPFSTARSGFCVVIKPNPRQKKRTFLGPALPGLLANPWVVGNAHAVCTRCPLWQIICVNWRNLRIATLCEPKPANPANPVNSRALHRVRSSRIPVACPID